MKTKVKFLACIGLFSLSAGMVKAQVAINNTATNADASAVLDLNSGNAGVNKGFLAPQVTLTDVTMAAPVVAPATGLMVYSTAAPTGGNGTGYYYWNGTSWTSLGAPPPVVLANLTPGTGLTGSAYNGSAAVSNWAVTYGSAANTAVMGNTTFTITAGTGLSGGGSIIEGTGGTITLNATGPGGSGMLNFGARWTPNGKTLGIGLIQDDSATVGINAPPQAGSMLYVTGNNSIGVEGISASQNQEGVWGEDDSYNGGIGVWGQSDSNVGVEGINYGESGFGMQGISVDGTPIFAWLNVVGATTGAAITDYNDLTGGFGAPNYVNYYDGNLAYKIMGPGVVSTIVKGAKGNNVVLHAPESPEIYFEDYGEGQLTNGTAHIALDPDFAANVTVNDKHPLRVFIQLYDNETCKGVIVKNRSVSGFDVVELNGGSSNTAFSWHIVCNRADETFTNGNVSHNADARFEKAPAANPEMIAKAKAALQRGAKHQAPAKAVQSVKPVKNNQ